MVFSYTGGSSGTSTVETTGNRANCTQIGPNLYYTYGTWTAGSAATATIVTGFSKVLWANVSNNEAQAEQPRCKPNYTGGGVAAGGSIGILAFTDAVNNTGNWFAIGRN